MAAVMSMKGESDQMTVPAAVAMIRATPSETRLEFAAEDLAEAKGQGN